MESGGGEYLCRCPLYLCKGAHTPPPVFLCTHVLNTSRTYRHFCITFSRHFEGIFFNHNSYKWSTYYLLGISISILIFTAMNKVDIVIPILGMRKNLKQVKQQLISALIFKSMANKLKNKTKQNQSRKHHRLSLMFRVFGAGAVPSATMSPGIPLPFLF